MRKPFAPWVALALVSAGVVGYWQAGSRTARNVPPGVDDADQAEEAAASDFDLVVDYKDDVGQAKLDATPFAEEAISAESAVDKMYRIRFDNEADAEAAAAILRQDPDVESVDWDAPAALPSDEALAARTPAAATCEPDSADASHRGFPNDPCFKYQWHLGQIGLPGAWTMSQGEGVVVAVIDTGVTAVPDLAGTELVPGYNFVANNSNAADDHGHGTHVAGTIAQATNNGLGVAGVAFGAKIMPLKVLSAQGSGSMAAIAQAIRYAADHGAKVVNMSLGGPFPVATIRKAVKYATDKGVLVVAAAGNDGKGRVSYPARYPEVLAVAATQFDESTTFYSNWGPDVDIAAPGGNVRVDQNGDGKPDGVLQNTIVPGNIGKTDYLWFMGTSMASPHVAGVAALLVGAGVNRPDAVEALMRATARRPKVKGVAAPGSDGRIDDHYGAGIVDAAAALRKAKTTEGAGGLALGGALALVGLAGLRRRSRLVRLGWSAPLALVLGAGGLFFLPFLVAVPKALAFLTVGLPLAVPATFAGFALGSPLLLSALLPLGAIALFAGVPRLRPALGGFAFGVAGLLAVLALTGAVNVTFVPDSLDRVWLALNVAACVLLGRSILKR